MKTERKAYRRRTRTIPEPLIDSDQAAAIIGVAPKTLQKYARRGLIQGVHVGKFWRFRASVIDEWISREFASLTTAETNDWRPRPVSTNLIPGQSCSPTKGEEHEASTASTRKSAA